LIVSAYQFAVLADIFIVSAIIWFIVMSRIVKVVKLDLFAASLEGIEVTPAVMP
jgi:hypothetical protein